jgi:hypothetical protein
MRFFPLKRVVAYFTVAAAINLLFTDIPVIKALLIAASFSIVAGIFDIYFDRKYGAAIAHDLDKMDKAKVAIGRIRK